jgi:NADP-dependent 3-hydroxy acid dehydrogenase YdfG
MTDGIDGKVVVVTGASSGIGKASALALADQGARLVLAARRKKELEDTAVACRAKGTEVVTVITDVADEAQVQALAKNAIETFGHIDVWFNNAGMDAFGRFEDIPPETFERVLQINLMGTVHGARAALPHFLERNSGILINNASLVGNCPSPFHSPMWRASSPSGDCRSLYVRKSCTYRMCTFVFYRLRPSTHPSGSVAQTTADGRSSRWIRFIRWSRSQTFSST